VVDPGRQESVQAYPLQWPDGRPRSKHREHALFKVTREKALQSLASELDKIGASNEVLSSNVSLRLDGRMRANETTMDPGVAVYFTYKKHQMCFACDKYYDVKDNIRAIAKTIEALRGIERWGTGDMLERAFMGFQALPNPAQWWHVLGFDSTAGMTKDALEDRFRQLAMQRHPDRGGSSDAMAELNWAREKGLEHLGS
jgi:hypothetical protein